jgi:hypothetical protein
MIDEPLLGAPADVKACGHRSAAFKASVALTLSVLAVGSICYPQGRNPDVAKSSLRPDATDIGGRDTSLDLMSARTVSNSSLGLHQAELIGRDTSKKFMGRLNTSKDAGLEDLTSAASTGPTEIPPDVLKEAVRDFTGLEGGARCVAAFLFDRGASSACAAASPTLVAAVTVVLSIYVLFFFAPFYMFPEAAVALGLWKVFPILEEAIVVSTKDKSVFDTMRLGLLLTALVAVLSRFLTLWKERNEPIATGRQSSMLISLIVGFVLYVILNYLSGGI